MLDLDAIRSASLRLAVDPLGGAGVRYWGAIAEMYQLNLTVTNQQVDPTFRLIPLDFDGRIRMDPSSRYAMQSLIELKDRFDVAFACDADHDRHGIVTKGAGLLPPNHYLVACIQYLFVHRLQWPAHAGVGKTAVSSSMIDRVTTALGRPLYEVPVGFKWFVDGLLNGALGFVGEESAGATFLRRDGSVWTTDKDGIVAALLAAEMMATTGRDPGEIYAAVTRDHGDPVYERLDAPANQQARAALARASREDLKTDRLAGESITQVMTRAPGNSEPLGGIKVVGGKRMVCGTALGDRGAIQDVRREFSRRGSSTTDPGRRARSGRRTDRQARICRQRRSITERWSYVRILNARAQYART